MKVVFMCGNHPRHRYMARKLQQTRYLEGLVVEKRKSHVPEPPEELDKELKKLFRHHFERREKAEDSFFGKDKDFPETESLKIEKEDLNSQKTQEFIERIDPDLVVTYGVHLLSDQTIKHSTADFWNIHGGLSPRYRGVITHFWPSYMLQPQMTGVTLHEITPEIDGGSIFHQSKAPLVRGDGIHELASRTVKDFADNHIPKVLEIFKEGDLKEPKEQEKTGKVWYSKDWRPEHLIPIYKHYDNSIVDKYLDGEFKKENPNLIQQFEP